MSLQLLSHLNLAIFYVFDVFGSTSRLLYFCIVKSALGLSLFNASLTNRSHRHPLPLSLPNPSSSCILQLTPWKQGLLAPEFEHIAASLLHALTLAHTHATLPTRPRHAEGCCRRRGTWRRRRSCSGAHARARRCRWCSWVLTLRRGRQAARQRAAQRRREQHLAARRRIDGEDAWLRGIGFASVKHSPGGEDSRLRRVGPPRRGGTDPTRPRSSGDRNRVGWHAADAGPEFPGSWWEKMSWEEQGDRWAPRVSRPS